MRRPNSPTGQSSKVVSLATIECPSRAGLIAVIFPDAIRLRMPDLLYPVVRAASLIIVDPLRSGSASTPSSFGDAIVQRAAKSGEEDHLFAQLRNPGVSIVG
jgi:hypothetical protein